MEEKGRKGDEEGRARKGEGGGNLLRLRSERGRKAR